MNRIRRRALIIVCLSRSEKVVVYQFDFCLSVCLRLLESHSLPNLSFILFLSTPFFSSPLYLLFFTEIDSIGLGFHAMIPWRGISCCLSGAALFLLGSSSGRSVRLFRPFALFIFNLFIFVSSLCRDAEILKTVTRVNQLKELGMLSSFWVFLSQI